MTVREATEADLPGVLRIYAQAVLDAAAVVSLEDARARWRRFAQYPSYNLALSSKP